MNKLISIFCFALLIFTSSLVYAKTQPQPGTFPLVLYAVAQVGKIYAPQRFFSSTNHRSIPRSSHTLLSRTDHREELTGEEIKFKWDKGFKGGKVYGLPAQGWEMFLHWTRFRTSSPELERNMGFNTLDLTFGKDFYPSDKIALKPAVGVKAATIRSRTNMLNENLIYKEPQQDIILETMFKGIGLQGSLDGALKLPGGFGLFGFTSLGFVRGAVQQIGLHFLSPLSLPVLHDTSRVIIYPVASTIGGFSWEKVFSENAILRLRIGYEVQFWWNQMRSINIAGIGNSNLSFDGVMSQIKFDF